MVGTIDITFEKLLRTLLVRFMKPAVLEEASNDKLFKIDCMDVKNHIPSNEIDVGFVTEREIQAKNRAGAITE